MKIQKNIPTKKEIRKIDKIIKIPYKIKFIDSFRFIPTSLSDLVDNLSEGLHKSSDIDFKDFMKIFKKYTAEPYSFLVNDTSLPSDDPLRFRKNLLG